MLNATGQQPTDEENELIEVTAELLNFITENNEELMAIEAEMITSMESLQKLHPRYCLIKANLVKDYLSKAKRERKVSNERYN